MAWALSMLKQWSQITDGITVKTINLSKERDCSRSEQSLFLHHPKEFNNKMRRNAENTLLMSHVMILIGIFSATFNMPRFVPVVKDLSKVKTKVALNLTKRQLLCFSAAGAIGIPVYLLTRGTIGTSAAVLVMIALMLPLFFVAMYEKDGQPAEIVLRNIVRVKLWSRTRPYKTENLYSYLESEGKNIVKQDKTTRATRTASAKKHRTGRKK